MQCLISLQQKTINGLCYFLLLMSLGLAPVPVSAADEGAAPLYLALGGATGLRKIVDDLVDLVLADTRINASFEGVDLPRLRRLLLEQFCEVSGGPCTYSGKSMALIHEDLQIRNVHFNAMVEDLQTVLEQHHISARAQFALIGKLAAMQRNIVSK